MENVDNMWVFSRCKIMETHKKRKMPRADRFFGEREKTLCKQKNPHSKVEVFPNLNVDNVDNLFPEKMFSDIYDISGAHSYQQVAVHTIF